MKRTTRVLYGMAVLLLLGGLVLRVAPAPAEPALPEAALNVTQDDVPPKPVGEVPATGAAIISGNIFSASRSAPRVRYTPADLAPAARDPRSTRTAPAQRLRLFGTVVGPLGTAALIDADPAVRGAEIYQVGDTIDGRRVAAVSESTVVLDGRAGRLVLRLRPAGPPTR